MDVTEGAEELLSVGRSEETDQDGLASSLDTSSCPEAVLRTAVLERKRA